MSIHDSTVHTLSFECELYLSKIKSYMVSKQYEERARMYHQIHIGKGLGQILPYIVNWIQTTVCDYHFHSICYLIIVIIILIIIRYNQF